MLKLLQQLNNNHHNQPTYQPINQIIDPYNQTTQLQPPIQQQQHHISTPLCVCVFLVIVHWNPTKSNPIESKTIIFIV